MKFSKVILSACLIMLTIADVFMLSGCTEDSRPTKDNTSLPAYENKLPEKQVEAGEPHGAKEFEITVPQTKIQTGRRMKPSLSKDSVSGYVYKKDSHVPARKVAYLTFDDGPSRNNTPKNLDTLKKYGIKATFFVLPHKNVDDIYKRILDEGHDIGNHSYSHNYRLLYGMEDYNFRLDLSTARDFIKEKLNYTTTLYRFPGGTMGRSRKILKSRIDILKEEGYDYVDWDVSDGDADPGNLAKKVDVLVSNVLQRTAARNSAIILMHDSEDKTATVEALPQIIKGLKKQGYEFDLLTESQGLNP